jgi:hypothetical protein
MLSFITVFKLFTPFVRYYSNSWFFDIGNFILEKNDLISYWASAINGRNIKIEVGDYLFDDYITDTNIFFPEKKNYMVFEIYQHQTSFVVWRLILIPKFFLWLLLLNNA